MQTSLTRPCPSRATFVRELTARANHTGGGFFQHGSARHHRECCKRVCSHLASAEQRSEIGVHLEDSVYCAGCDNSGPPSPSECTSATGRIRSAAKWTQEPARERFQQLVGGMRRGAASTRPPAQISPGTVLNIQPILQAAGQNEVCLVHELDYHPARSGGEVQVDALNCAPSSVCSYMPNFGPPALISPGALKPRMSYVGRLSTCRPRYRPCWHRLPAVADGLSQSTSTCNRTAV
jgi:hypothetical protein